MAREKKEKEEITRETIARDVALFEKGEFSKAKMSLDWMDAYVAFTHPDSIDDWVSKCMTFPRKIKNFGKKGEEKVEREVRDVVSVRKYFIETYFPDYTPEAKEREKLEKARKKEEERKRREEEKDLSDEEKFIRKMERLKKQG